jgi:hypothetical protein
MAYNPEAVILTADFNWVPLSIIRTGDHILGADMIPRTVKRIEKYPIKYRRVFNFYNSPSFLFTEIDTLWARDQDRQWWWVENAPALQSSWKMSGWELHGLKVIDSMLVNYQVRYATINGWESKKLIDITEKYDYDYETIFLYTDDYSPIIVNGFVVNNGISEYIYDYAQFDWNKYQPLIKEKLIEKNQLIFPYR